MFNNILVPTDGSDLAAKAVEQGVLFAKEIGAKITAMTVTEPFHLLSVSPANSNGSVTVMAVILAPISLAKRTPCSTALAARSDPSVGIKQKRVCSQQRARGLLLPISWSMKPKWSLPTLGAVDKRHGRENRCDK